MILTAFGLGNQLAVGTCSRPCNAGLAHEAVAAAAGAAVVVLRPLGLWYQLAVRAHAGPTNARLTHQAVSAIARAAVVVLRAA